MLGQNQEAAHINGRTVALLRQAANKTYTVASKPSPQNLE
jgi:hypothetical protein